MCTKFGVDSLSHFPFRALMHTDTQSQMPLITLPTHQLLLAWIATQTAQAIWDVILACI